MYTLTINCKTIEELQNTVNMLAGARAAIGVVSATQSNKAAPEVVVHADRPGKGTPKVQLGGTVTHVNGEPAASLDNIKHLILSIAKKNADEAKAVLAEFGAKNVSGLTEAQYPAVVKLAQEKLAELGQ